MDSLTNGVMRQQGSDMTEAEKRAVADISATRPRRRPPPRPPTAGACASTPPFDPGADRNGTAGASTSRTAFPAGSAGRPHRRPGPEAQLKWAFGFPNANSARGLPTIAGGRLFVGSMSGTVYALDAKSGCIIWTFQAQSGVRAGIVIGPRAAAGPGHFTAYLGDGRSNAYALDAATGEQIWTRNLEDHRSANITGTPTLHEGRLFVPSPRSKKGRG